MEMIDALLSRRAVRAYIDETVSEECLNLILQAGLTAPTGHGKQPREFVVVTDDETLKTLSEARQTGSARMLASASAAIAVFGDPEGADTWVEDCSIAMTAMWLEADALGLGACWIQCRGRDASDDETTGAYVSRVLGAPEGLQLLAMLSVGHPAKHPEPRCPEDLHWEKVHRGSF